MEAAVEAAVTGSRKLMAEALVLDGGIPGSSVAERPRRTYCGLRPLIHRSSNRSRFASPNS